jgi:hypothetical protein
MNNQNKLLKIKLNISLLCALLLQDSTLLNECINDKVIYNLKILLLKEMDLYIYRNRHQNLNSIMFSDNNQKMRHFIKNNYNLNELFLYIDQPLGKKIVLLSKLWINLYNQHPTHYVYDLFKHLINLFNTYVKTNFPDYLNKSHSLNLIIKMVSKLDYANCNKFGDPSCSQSFKVLIEKQLQINRVPENWWPKNRKQLYFNASEESEFIPNIIQLLNIMLLRMWCRDIYRTYSYSVDIIDDHILIENQYKEEFLKVLKDYFITRGRITQLCYSLILQHFKPYPTDISILIKSFRASIAKQSVMKAHILKLKSRKFTDCLITIIND